MTSFITALYFAGLLLMAFDDWRYQSVPAPLCDGWLVTVGGVTLLIHPLNAVYALVFAGCLSLFAWMTQGLGSADIIVLAAAVCAFGMIAALLSLLIAAMCGIFFAMCTHTKRIAFIPHLLAGTCLALVLQAML